MRNRNSNPYCRVCGYEPGEPPWGDDGETPTYEICPSCGAEYGYHDATPTGVVRYRAKWLESGGHWADRTVPGDGLDTAERLSRVAREVR